MLPQLELQLFRNDLAVAAECAAEGDPEEGYRILEAGLRAAESKGCEAWSGELIRHYEAALIAFAQEQRVLTSHRRDVDEK